MRKLSEGEIDQYIANRDNLIKEMEVFCMSENNNNKQNNNNKIIQISGWIKHSSRANKFKWKP